MRNRVVLYLTLLMVLALSVPAYSTVETELGIKKAVGFAKEGKYGLAIKELERVGEKEPGNQTVWMYLGMIYKETKQYGKAMKYFIRAENLGTKTEVGKKAREQIGILNNIFVKGKIIKYEGEVRIHKRDTPEESWETIGDTCRTASSAKTATDVSGAGVSPVPEVEGGDRIKTGVKAYCDIKYKDGTVARVKANTEIGIEELFCVDGKYEVVIKLWKGKLQNRVKKLGEGERYEIMTPSAVCGVRGTIFSIEEEGGSSEVKVYEGQVEVNSMHMPEVKARMVGEGEKISVKKEGMGDTAILNEQDRKEEEDIRSIQLGRLLDFGEEYGDGPYGNDMLSMAIDGDTIWIGTMSGVCIYDKVTKKWKRLKEFGDFRVSAITIDGDTIWFGSSTIIRYNKVTGNMKNYNLDFGDYIRSIILLDENSIYFIDHSGNLFSFNIEKEENPSPDIYSIFIKLLQNYFSKKLDNLWVDSILKEKENIWFSGIYVTGVTKGDEHSEVFLARYNKDKNEFKVWTKKEYEFLKGRVFFLDLDLEETGILWVGTWEGDTTNLYKCEIEKGKINERIIRNENKTMKEVGENNSAGAFKGQTAFYRGIQKEEKNIYFCYRGYANYLSTGGFQIYDKVENKIESFRSFYLKEPISKVSEYSRYVWFDNKLYDKMTKKWKEYFNFQNFPTMDFVFDGNNFYFSSPGGIVKFNIEQGEFITNKEIKDVGGMCRDGNNIWVGTKAGIIKWNPKTNKKIEYGFKNGLPETAKYVKIIKKDRFVIAGTNKGGIYVYDRETNRWRKLKKEEAGGKEIKDIVIDEKNLWVLCEEKRYNKEKGDEEVINWWISVMSLKDMSWKEVGKEDGLKGKEARGIEVSDLLSDRDRLLIATDEGVDAIEVNDKGEIKIKQITTADGLISDNILTIHKGEQYFYVGTDKGVNVW